MKMRHKLIKSIIVFVILIGLTIIVNGMKLSGCVSDPNVIGGVICNYKTNTEMGMIKFNGGVYDPKTFDGCTKVGDKLIPSGGDKPLTASGTNKPAPII